MSEEILKALMQLFALIVKQDGGMMKSERDYVETFLRKQISLDSVNEYLERFDNYSGPVLESAPDSENTPPSVKDSVRIFAICKKINRTLNQSQKIVVLMRLYELVDSDNRYTLQRMNIINTVAEVFRIAPDEFRSIETFVKKKDSDTSDDSSILTIRNMNQCLDCDDETDQEGISSLVHIIRIASVDLYFIKHYSQHQLSLNGLPLLIGKIYTMAKGSSIRYLHGHPIYYSDIASHFFADSDFKKISLVVENLTYKFREGNIAINSINLTETEGTLVGIMGSSGTGKTTLLNLMSGMQAPFSGSVRINSIDVHAGGSSLEGVIGYVPQDDTLIEDLTVFENLYYAARLCFKDKSRQEITTLVDRTLQSLGLYEKRDLKVGTPLKKVISGGQRKRLNIALELIREPSVLFLDEPTSGLSSRDSENVIDLLRELTFKGKLLFTVIHQPSSEIFKMFDKMLILDQGGEMVYYGNPIEALIYFKILDTQIDSNIGECPTCGNINPETIFNIIETEVVDEFGKYTGVRKVLPGDWSKEFQVRHDFQIRDEVKETPPSNLNRPNKLKQFLIFARRDMMSKIANRQYVLLTLLEAPILGFILSYIVRYIADPSSKKYIYLANENIPIYIFMGLIVALFLGLISSAEEIFKDRKVLKREHFLNLSHSSYLLAKIIILFFISALQTLLFVLIANSILGIKGLTFQYWFAFFSTAAVANVLGLNISSSFNSAITIYIVVPMLMIPMMVLSGAMFPFDKLNRTIGSVGKVPVIAEIMPTKWTYEALIVTQAKDNRFDKVFYDIDKEKSVADFNTVFRLPALESALNRTFQSYREKELSVENPAKLKLIYNEFSKIAESGVIDKYPDIDRLNPVDFNHLVAESASEYISQVKSIYNKKYNSAENRKDKVLIMNRGEELDNLYDQYHNLRLEDIVKKVSERTQILEYRDNLIQNYDPIYQDPSGESWMGIRSHFLSPAKRLFNIHIDTYLFNIAVVWIMALFLYIMLYFNVLPFIMNFFTRR